MHEPADAVRQHDDAESVEKTPELARIVDAVDAPDPPVVTEPRGIIGKLSDSIAIRIEADAEQQDFSAARPLDEGIEHRLELGDEKTADRRTTRVEELHQNRPTTQRREPESAVGLVEEGRIGQRPRAFGNGEAPRPLGRRYTKAVRDGGKHRRARRNGGDCGEYRPQPHRIAIRRGTRTRKRRTKTSTAAVTPHPHSEARRSYPTHSGTWTAQRRGTPSLPL